MVKFFILVALVSVYKSVVPFQSHKTVSMTLLADNYDLNFFGTDSSLRFRAVLCFAILLVVCSDECGFYFLHTMHLTNASTFEPPPPSYTVLET